MKLQGYLFIIFWLLIIFYSFNALPQDKQFLLRAAVLSFTNDFSFLMVLSVTHWWWRWEYQAGREGLFCNSYDFLQMCFNFIVKCIYIHYLPDAFICKTDVNFSLQLWYVLSNLKNPDFFFHKEAKKYSVLSH